MTMMGGPIDARSPTAVNNLAMNKTHSWFEKRDLPRAAELPGAGRVYPRLLAAHTGFVAMNPTVTCIRTTTTSSTWCAATTAAPRRTAVLRRIQRRARHAGRYYLDTIKRCSGNSRWSRHLVRGRQEGRPPGHPPPALHPSKANSTTSRAPARQGGARPPCTGIPAERRFAYDVARRRPLAASSPGRRWRRMAATRKCARSSPIENKAANEPSPPPAKAPAPAQCPTRRTDRGRIDAAAAATQCTRCGYRLRTAYAAAIAARRPINQCPPGGAQERIARLAALTGRPCVPLESRPRHPKARCRPGGDRSIGLVHRLPLCIKACPGRLHRRRVKPDAHVDDDQCTGANCVCRLPGGLHRHGRRHPEGPQRLGRLGQRSKTVHRAALCVPSYAWTASRAARNDERLIAKAQAKLADWRRNRESPTLNCCSAALRSSKAALARRASPLIEPSRPTTRSRTRFATLAGANPQAGVTGWNSSSVFELLAAVLLSAQIDRRRREQSDHAAAVCRNGRRRGHARAGIDGLGAVHPGIGLSAPRREPDRHRRC